MSHGECEIERGVFEFVQIVHDEIVMVSHFVGIDLVLHNGGGDRMNWSVRGGVREGVREGL